MGGEGDQADRPAEPAAAGHVTALGHPVEAVIFDLDGVLVDSEIWWDEVRAAFAAAHERPWTLDDRHAVMGQNSRQWAETMRGRLGLEMDPGAIETAVVDAMVRRYAREGPPEIGDASHIVVKVAAWCRTAVASSAHRAVIDAALGGLGLAGVLDVIVSSDEVAHGKPAPDVYLETATRLSVAPERCLVVEDSINGIRAAKRAGMLAVLVPNASVPPAEGASALADATLASLSDVPDLVLRPGPSMLG